MGSPSYIVRGKGNELSFNSCSHGAGRRMSRTAARNAVTPSAFEASLKGTFSQPSMGYADEAPQAYKNIATVIGRQTDLVDILHEAAPRSSPSRATAAPRMTDPGVRRQT